MVPPGGSSTLYGVLYQLLGSLQHVVRLRLRKKGASIVVEPRDGGDVKIGLPGQRVREQWKARTTGRPWTLPEIAGSVLPDLYQDPDLEQPTGYTKYVFATEGRPNEEARAFFLRLHGPVTEGDPVAGLSPGDEEVFREMAGSVRKRQRFRSEPDSITHLKLRRLLSRFEIREGLTAENLTREIDGWLLPLVNYREDVPATRERLCTMILSKASRGEVEIVPEDLLRDVGLRGTSLQEEDKLWRGAREAVEREVRLRGYDRDRDVRARPDWPEDKRFLVLAGESGHGKTWQLARLALDLAREEVGNKPLTVFLVSRGNATVDLQRAADLLWKQAWIMTIPNPSIVSRPTGGRSREIPAGHGSWFVWTECRASKKPDRSSQSLTGSIGVSGWLCRFPGKPEPPWPRNGRMRSNSAS